MRYSPQARRANSQISRRPTRWLGATGALALCLLACTPRPPRFEYAQLASQRMGRNMDYAVYLPGAWSAGERLPLIVFLHGAGDGPNALDQAGIGNLLDRPGAPRAIIVAPRGDRGFWENWASGERPYRDWVMRELVPAVQRRYHTLPCPSDCHVIGISMGGYGALMMALREPGAFSSVAALSAPIYTAESVKPFYDSWLWNLLLPIEDIWGPYDPSKIATRDLHLQWHSNADLHGSRLLLAWGDQDLPNLRAGNERLHQHLTEHGIAHEAVLFRGGHKWASWTTVVLDALRWGLEPELD